MYKHLVMGERKKACGLGVQKVRRSEYFVKLCGKKLEISGLFLVR